MVVGDVFAYNGTLLPSGVGAVADQAMGTSMAVSSDGTVVAVGGPGVGEMGGTWIYRWDGASWSQSLIVGAGMYGTAQGQGQSCALSSDGLTLAVGGPLSGVSASFLNVGATWIFKWSGSAWAQQAVLQGTGASGTQSQGTSCALSSDGRTLAVGGSATNSGVGATWVFRYDGTTWTQQAMLVGTGATGTQSQGYSCALSSNGLTLATGGPATNGLMGATWVFQCTSGTSWTQQAMLVGTGSIGYYNNNAYQGASCALSQDGLTLAVGAPGDGGGVWINTWNGTTWTQQALVMSSVSRSNGQGSSCALASTSNGLMLVVGGQSTDNNLNMGATWVHRWNGSAWVQQAYIMAPEMAPEWTGYTSLQGCACALSPNGTHLAVGAFVANSNMGAAWMYTLCFPGSLSTLTVCSYNQTLMPIIGSSLRALGSSTAMSSDGTVMAVGAPGLYTTNFSSTAIWGTGCVAIYRWNGMSWGAPTTVVGTGMYANGRREGCSCALSSDGNTLAFGGYLSGTAAFSTTADGFQGNVGATWVFKWNGSTWVQQAVLQGTGGSGVYQNQGYSCALSSDGRTLATCGPYTTTINGKFGATWVFRYSGTSWTQQAILVGTGDDSIGQTQGFSCALSSDGRTLAVGAISPYLQVGGTFVFHYDGTVWTQQALIVGTGLTGYQTQGNSCALSSDGRTLAVGGVGGNTQLGATWVHRYNGTAWAQQALIVGTGAPGGYQYQGSSCALSSDGNILAVGAPGVLMNYIYSGATWIHRWNGIAWTQQAFIFSNMLSTYNDSEQQGYACSLSHDGTTLVVGAPGIKNNTGGALVFNLSFPGTQAVARTVLAPRGGSQLVLQLSGSNLASPANLASLTATSSDLLLASAGGGGLTVQASTGNVGVNRLLPAFALDVSGAVNAVSLAGGGIADSLTLTSSAVVASAAACSNVYVVAAAALPASGGTVTGALVVRQLTAASTSSMSVTGGVGALGATAVYSSNRVIANLGAGSALTVSQAATFTVGATVALSVGSNVGVGKASSSVAPAVALDVSGSMAVSGLLTAASFVGSGAGLTGGWTLGANVTLPSGSNVGIGSTAPACALDVSGSARVSGQATLSANVGVGKPPTSGLALDVSGNVTVTGAGGAQTQTGVQQVTSTASPLAAAASLYGTVTFPSSYSTPPRVAITSVSSNVAATPITIGTVTKTNFTYYATDLSGSAAYAPSAWTFAWSAALSDVEIGGNVDVSGYVCSNQCVFYAIGSGSASAASGALQYATTVVNPGACYNAATFTFTAPVTGLYAMCATYPSSSSWVAFYRNGFPYGGVRHFSASDTPAFFNLLLYLTATDTVVPITGSAVAVTGGHAFFGSLVCAV